MEKKYFIGTLITFITGLIIWIIIIIHIDPSQQFKITNYPYGDARILNVGLARNLKYMVGSFVKQFLLKPKQFFCTQKLIIQKLHLE